MMTETRAIDAFHNLSIEQTAERLGVTPADGLPSGESEQRRSRYGYNEFEKEKRKTLFLRFMEQFRSAMIIILLVAAAISGIVGVAEGEGITDALIILLIVVVNACIGVAQEAKAEKALKALEKMSAPQCKVLRNGGVTIMKARELVPGDVVVIETGDQVPADIRLTEAANLKIQEAALTGESLPEDKHVAAIPGDVPLGDRDNMAYASSIVAYGRGRGIVVATGMRTEVGKIAAMLQSVPDSKTPMQRKIDQLGKILGIAAVSICASIFVTGFLQGRDILDMFMTAVSLAAAAIPEGLPAVSTIVLAVGVQRLARRNAIVRNLPSVETLGSASVVCSDKTGTLTQNKMTVMQLFTEVSAVEVPDTVTPDQRRLLLALVMANDAALGGTEGRWTTSGDPTETAFVELGVRRGLDKNDLEARRPRVAEVPFDSERKMMSTINRNPDGGFDVFVKGGVDEILSRCDSVFMGGEVRALDAASRKEIAAANAGMAAKALRVLAGAWKRLDAVPDAVNSASVENGLIFCGMAGMMDPPRPEVRAAVEKCRSAGIKPVMITGDHLATAVAIAESLDIKRDGDRHFSGSDLEKMSDEELEAVIEDASVYARVAPEHKVRIVRAFKKKGKIVGMTGDGVNDAPALKLADIGLAMGITGTDVSKGAADVVLADDNFATIVGAVEEGRRIYDNILKAIQFMLSTNLGEILVIFTGIMLGWPAPLLPVQILWINLVTDSLPALALAVDPADPDVMNRPPVRAERGIMEGGYLIATALQGIMIAVLSLAAFSIGMRTDVTTGQTMTFAVLAFAQVSHVLNVRSPRSSAFKSLLSNKWLLGALASVLFLMLIVMELSFLHDFFHLAPIGVGHWAWIIILSLAPLPIVEIVKGMVARRNGR